MPALERRVESPGTVFMKIKVDLGGGVVQGRKIKEPLQNL